MKKVTVYDVADRSGVSIATVSFTFHQPQRVKESTRAKVLTAARELGYVPSASARGLAKGRTGAIGLYSYDFYAERTSGDAGHESSDYVNAKAFPLYIDEIQRGFEIECWHQGKVLMLGAASLGNLESITGLAGRVDGLGIFPSWRTQELPLDQLSHGIPIVLLSENVNNVPVACITCDNDSGVTQLVDHLIDVHHIHSMSFVGLLEGYDMHQRYNVFRRHLAHRGLHEATPYLRRMRSTENEQPRFERLERDITDGNIARSLFCNSDQTALTVIEMLHRHGYSVPNDVVVTGFDGIQAGGIAQPALTTVMQPMQDMGRLAARLLIEQNGVPWSKPTSHQLPIRLVIRHSCGC